LSLNADILSSHLSFSGDVIVSLRIVNNLGLNGDVLNSLINLLYRFINHNSFLNFSSNVLHLSFYCIIISDSSFNGNAFISNNFLILNHLSFNGHLIDFLDLLVLHILLLKGDVFNSALNGDLLSHSF